MIENNNSKLIKFTKNGILDVVKIPEFGEVLFKIQNGKITGYEVLTKNY
ncbi:DUF2292 domain-containing protein [Streptococcus dysgalactiae subsp. dysgalactiae]|nr:DUF2292 domain-containing protein [Streptococcus dysgalactiae subsp. dysgalactiae]